MEKSARKVAARLREQGHIAYFAGGCVRDMVRGLTPKDYDIATDARPETVQALFPRTYAVGAHFGVIIVLEDGLQFEVATFRSDDAYIDGRHPSAVHFSSPEEDAKRRDFTINGMFYDPVAGEVIDLVGGQADIAAKLVRAIGDPAKRFAEDRLRMLRAVRFAAVLDYQIDTATWDALVANAPSINQISAERIRDELVRIFLSPNRVRGWDLLDASGLMRAVLPELEAMKGVLQPEQFHPEGDVFVHTRLMLSMLPENVSVPLVFAVLFHDVAKPVTATVDKTGRIRFNEHDRIGAEMTEAIMRRLRLRAAIGWQSCSATASMSNCSATFSAKKNPATAPPPSLLLDVRGGHRVAEEQEQGQAKDADPSTTIARNSGRMPATASVALRISRRFTINRNVHVDPMLEVFNLFNRTQFDAGNTNINKSVTVQGANAGVDPRAVKGWGGLFA